MSNIDAMAIVLKDFIHEEIDVIKEKIPDDVYFEIRMGSKGIKVDP